MRAVLACIGSDGRTFMGIQVCADGLTKTKGGPEGPPLRPVSIWPASYQVRLDGQPPLALPVRVQARVYDPGDVVVFVMLKSLPVFDRAVMV